MLSEQEARALLREGHVAPTPLALRVVDGGAVRPIWRGDFLIDLTWGDVRKGFVAEYKAVATPKKVEAAIREAKAYAREHGGRLPMVLLPHISESTAERLQAEGVSGLDFSGNVAVTVPGEWLVVRTGRPNRYPSSQPIKHVYEGKSALVGRALLGRPEYEHGQGRARRGRASGRVRQHGDGLEGALGAGGGPRRDEDRRRAPRSSRPCCSTGSQSTTTGRARPGAGPARPPSAPRSTRDLLEAARRGGSPGRRPRRVPLRRRSDQPGAHADLRLAAGRLARRPAVPGDRPVRERRVRRGRRRAAFFDPTVRDGLPWCSALQVYLELAGGGKRERDAAAQLRGDLLDAARLTPVPATP